MKKLNLLFTMLSLFVATSTFAQIEPKINPLALLLSGDISVGCEFILGDRLGVEPVIDFGKSDINLTGVGNVEFTGVGLRAIGKYYLNPNKGADKFYVGPYLKWKGGSGTGNITDNKITRNRIAAGLAIGWKVVASSGLVFEFGLGAGRAFNDTYKDQTTDETFDVSEVINLDLLGRLAVGYRIGASSSSSKGSTRKRR